MHFTSSYWILICSAIGVGSSFILQNTLGGGCYSLQMWIFRLREAPSVGLSDLTNENTGNIAWDTLMLKKFLLFIWNSNLTRPSSFIWPPTRNFPKITQWVKRKLGLSIFAPFEFWSPYFDFLLCDVSLRNQKENSGVKNEKNDVTWSLKSFSHCKFRSWTQALFSFTWLVKGISILGLTIKDGDRYWGFIW